MTSHEQIEPRTTDICTIDIQYEFSQAPAQVWRVLSEPELVAQWLSPNDISAEVGKHFSLRAQSGAIECEVLACEPERLLSYSWRSDQSGGDLDTVVTFILTGTADGGTHLRLLHSGLPQTFAPTVAQIIPLPRRNKPLLSSLLNHPLCGAKMLWAA